MDKKNSKKRKKIKLPLFTSEQTFTMPLNHGRYNELSDEMKVIYKAIEKRDAKKCYFCGFKSDKYQELHHLNGDHTNWNECNLVLTCPLCHQVNHLSGVGLESTGEIAFIPNNLINQQIINRFLILLFSLTHSTDLEIKNLAKKLIAGFQDTKTIMMSKNKDFCDPLFFCQFYLKSPDDFKQSTYFLDYKLIANQDAFLEQSRYYFENQYNRISKEVLLRLVDNG